MFFNGLKIPHSDLQSFGDSSKRYTLNIFFIKKMTKVFIGTPCYGNMLTADYFKSCLQLTALAVSLIGVMSVTAPSE